MNLLEFMTIAKSRGMDAAYTYAIALERMRKAGAAIEQPVTCPTNEPALSVDDLREAVARLAA